MSVDDNLRVPPLKFKDPEAVKDYQVNWAGYLSSGVTIALSTWAITVDPDSALAIDSESNTATTATVILSGGAVGAKYWVTNHCVFSDGTEDDQSIIMMIKEM